MSEATRGIVGILLAAGMSTRFGGNKLLFPMKNGTRMAVASARNMKSALEHVVAVVRPGSKRLRELFEAAGLTVVTCPDADEGMGRSLACGIAATANATGWLIALADMPFVLPDTIRRVASALADGAPLAAPYCNEQRGHPVGFGAEFCDALLTLSGDQGARSLVTANESRLHRIRCYDPGVLADVDLRSDLDGAP